MPENKESNDMSFTLIIFIAIGFVGFVVGCLAMSLFGKETDGCEHQAMAIAMTKQCEKLAIRNKNQSDDLYLKMDKIKSLRASLTEATQLISLEKAKADAVRAELKVAKAKLHLAELLLNPPE